MDIPTIPGAVYTISSTSSCDVTDKASGQLLGTASSGSPFTTPAYSDALTLSDPSALYVQIKTFNFALAALGLLGGGVQVHPAIMKYANCVTVADMQAVNPDYKNDLTADGEWIYALPKLQNAYGAFNTFEKCKAWLVDLPSLENGGFMLVRYGGTLFDIALPLLENGESMFRNMKGSKTFKAALPRLKNGVNMFSCVALYGLIYLSFESDLPMLEKGSGMFNLNALDKASVLRICNSIPIWNSGSHTLTLGIHIDHQTDEEVLEAIANAESKGWTLTVQWNGPQTAQTSVTYGLRKPPIFAKVSSMARPDGTTENFLDWGHYVTEAEANGYQEFASVEDANAYFELKEELLTA